MIVDSIASNLQKSMWDLWKRCREHGLRNPFLVTILMITQAQERNLKTKCEDISSLLEAVELEFGYCDDNVQLFLDEFCDQWLNGGLHCELAFETALDLGMRANNSVGMVSSSKSMAAVMATAAMAGVKEFSKSPRIWDPCCGSGGSWR